MRFWQGKRVFLTGHTGFKGSWLSLWLQCLGAEVVGYSLPAPTTPSLFEIAAVADNMTTVQGDIRDFSLLQKTIHEHQPELVIHLAAQPLVRYSYQEPVDTYAVNVMGTVNLLEALRQERSVKAIVNVTTDKCYENKDLDVAFHEEDRLGGKDPYSNSKACSELVTAAYRDSYFNLAQTGHPPVGLATARAGNVIGGGDWAQDRLVPDIINACQRQQTVSIRNPHALRPWQHVLEPLSGYLLLAQRLYELPSVYAGAWNFGPTVEDVKPVSWIVNYIIDRWENNAGWRHDEAPGPHEASYLKLGCEKAKVKLGWQPRWNLEKGIAETMRWYQALQNQENMKHFTVGQIEAFMGTPHESNRSRDRKEASLY